MKIRLLIARDQGSTGTMEYPNLEVSGDTVTFDNIFIMSTGSTA
jgi:hypothetical protein